MEHHRFPAPSWSQGRCKGLSAGSCNYREVPSAEFGRDLHRSTGRSSLPGRKMCQMMSDVSSSDCWFHETFRISTRMTLNYVQHCPAKFSCIHDIGACAPSISFFRGCVTSSFKVEIQLACLQNLEIHFWTQMQHQVRKVLGESFEFLMIHASNVSTCRSGIWQRRRQCLAAPQWIRLSFSWFTRLHWKRFPTLWLMTMTMYTSRIVFDWSKVLGEQSIPAHAPNFLLRGAPILILNSSQHSSFYMLLHHPCSSSSLSRLITAPPVFGSFPQSTGLSHRLIVLVGVSPSLVHIPGSSPSPDATVSSNVSGGETSKVVECHCTLGAKRFHSGEQGAMLGEMWWWVKMGKDGQRVNQLRLFGWWIQDCR